MTAAARRTVVVVPDGLAAAAPDLEPLPEPSFVFRAVLDHVLARHREARILLAPANRFGGGCTEQAAAAAYLRARGIADAEAPEPPGTGYIDTRGNARELRGHLRAAGDWPPPPVTLVVARLHARRAVLCFRREGFDIAEVEPVPYAVPANEAVVRRLWYYRHPAVHRIYEAMALLRDLLRPAEGRRP